MKKILLFIVFFTYSLQAFSSNLDDSNKLFIWAEENYSVYFSPAGEGTFKIENYLVRYYKDTDTYIGTLGQDVYIYGDIFNGLQHIGSIGDFIELTNNTSKIVDNIKVTGSNEFILQTEAALEVLKKLAPNTFAKIQLYIGIIEQGKNSHIWVYEQAPRYEVSDIDAFQSIKWYAGTIAHEMIHSELYHEYQVKHGLPVPADIWSSDSAERMGIEYQIEVMIQINAPQFDIDFLNNLDETGNLCNINEICD